MKRLLVSASVALLVSGVIVPAASTAATNATPVSKHSSSQANIYFDPGKSLLTPSARAVLDDVAAEYADGWNFAVAGYVQSSANTRDDRSLSMARAQAVRAYLRTAGVLGKFSVRAVGVFPGTPGAAAARQAIVKWSAVAAVDPTPEPTPEPTPTPTPTPTPAPTTCTVGYDAQGGVMADTTTVTLTVGASLLLRSVLYGPGDFAGWFTNPNSGDGSKNESAQFVGFATQSAKPACVAGSTITLYAHWSIPKSDSEPEAIAWALLPPRSESVTVTDVFPDADCNVAPELCAVADAAGHADMNANNHVVLWFLDIFGFFIDGSVPIFAPESFDNSKIQSVTLRSSNGTAIIAASAAVLPEIMPMLLAFHDDTVDLGALNYAVPPNMGSASDYFDLVYDGKHYYFVAAENGLSG